MKLTQYIFCNIIEVRIRKKNVGSVYNSCIAYMNSFIRFSGSFIAEINTANKQIFSVFSQLFPPVSKSSVQQNLQNVVLLQKAIHI